MTDREPVPAPLAVLASAADMSAASAVDCIEQLVALDAVKTVTGTRSDSVRERLHRLIDDVVAVTGTAPTLRSPSGTVVMTDPQPRVRIGDVDAFASDAASRGAPGVTSWPTVVVRDGADLQPLLDEAREVVNADEQDLSADWRQYALVLAEMVVNKVEERTEWRVGEHALGDLVDAGTIALTEHGRTAWTEDGAVVDGVEVTTGVPRLQVRLDKDARKVAVERLVGYLDPFAAEVDA